MKHILLMLALVLSSIASAEEPKGKAVSVRVFVVANRPDGLVVQKMETSYDSVRDPVSGKVFKTVRGTTKSEAKYFIPHTATTKDVPLSSYVGIKGVEKGSLRLNETVVLQSIQNVTLTGKPSMEGE